MNFFLFVSGTVLVPVKSYFGNFFELNFPVYLCIGQIEASESPPGNPSRI